MSKSSRPQKGDRHKADGTKETLQNEELVEFAATIPHAEYSEIDRYWRKMGWLSISSFLASAAQFAIDKRLEHFDSMPIVKNDELNESSNSTSVRLVDHRIASHVALFAKVKTAVELWSSGSAVGGAGAYFKALAKEVKESPPKISKMRNIAHLELAEYRAMVEQTSAQIVLDLGQDSRINRSIKRYNVGFILREIMRANRNSRYCFTQDDSEKFMGFIKSHIKRGHLSRMEEISNLCYVCGCGRLWGHNYFKGRAHRHGEMTNDLLSYAAEIYQSRHGAQ